MRQRPHDGVYTRLEPSKIHGVGVFAIRHIPRGTAVFGSDDESMVWVDKHQLDNVPAPVKKLYYDFCIVKGDKYGCPTNFNKLTISWYLNHSERPNVVIDQDSRFHALRDIDPGEELTADYRLYSDEPELGF